MTTVPRSTMADVARVAAVSIQTVSRVVNGRKEVRAETRERVQLVISQLQYRPNAAARALVTKRSATVGIIGQRTGLFGPDVLNRNLQDAARVAGFYTTSVTLDGLTLDDLGAAAGLLREQGVDGAILVASTYDTADIVRAQEALGGPIVVVDGNHVTNRYGVGVDSCVGGRLATQHLLDLGHTAIVHVTGPLSWTEARSRLRGWQQAMHDAGLGDLRSILGDWNAKSGYEAGLAILAHPGTTAVFCANDQMALGLLRAVSEVGLCVPDDISVVGFDDMPEAGYFTPPLTTVRQDMSAISENALRTLAGVLAGDSAQLRPVQPRLVVRASTAAVSGRSGPLGDPTTQPAAFWRADDNTEAAS